MGLEVSKSGRGIETIEKKGRGGGRGIQEARDSASGFRSISYEKSTDGLETEGGKKEKSFSCPEKSEHGGARARSSNAGLPKGKHYKHGPDSKRGWKRGKHRGGEMFV